MSEKKLTIVYRDPKELVPYTKNAKLHPRSQIREIAASIKEFGFRDPVGYADDTMEIIEGHGRLQAVLEDEELRDLYKTIPCIDLKDLSPDQRKAYRLVHNKLTTNTGYDDQLVHHELVEIYDQFDFVDLGWSMPELIELGLEIAPEPEDLDNIIFDVGEPRINRGEIYTLGAHRLMCGDAQNSNDIKVLLNNRFVDVVLTDPPYGLDIVQDNKVGISHETGFGKVGTKVMVGSGTYKKIAHDDEPFDPTHLLNMAPKVFIFGANNFASKLPDRSHWLVWDKKVERGADRNNFSDVELIWTNIDRKSCIIYRYLWSGLLREGKRDVELKTRICPTQKPVGLMQKIIEDYSDQGAIIMDLYGGSGSILIACEISRRVSFTMEIDPYYCEMILKRWEQFTGKEAVLEK